MEEICNTEKCTGCSVCMNVCPKNCITMIEDNYGNIIPKIDKTKCINCGLCSKKCPVNNKKSSNVPRHAYASWNLKEEERKTSSSGGLAYIFYKYVIEHGGCAIGCEFNKDIELKLSIANDMTGIEKFKGSKYVQSYTGHIYQEIKEKLENDIETLFIGTPCQVNGLKNFLGKEYETLITVDIICHGVLSQALLHDHINAIERRTGKKVNNLSFRDSNSYILTMCHDNEVIYKKSSREDLYYLGFLNGIFYRESCYQCEYANINRISDITIGDFWGLGKEKEFRHSIKNGVSLVLTNTEKGDKFLKKCSDKLFIEERDIEEAIKENEQLRNPSKKTEKYELFRKSYIKYGTEKSLKKCFKNEIYELRKEKIINKVINFYKKRG